MTTPAPSPSALAARIPGAHHLAADLASRIATDLIVHRSDSDAVRALRLAHTTATYLRDVAADQITKLDRAIPSTRTNIGITLDLIESTTQTLSDAHTDARTSSRWGDLPSTARRILAVVH